ncbi:LCP family protein [Ammoniphilus sp. CFH 90114]|uniref:LCP family protein n=1 Tax=Ammoniphilus sp. CFH 90114 TaxID=2493665 RepID=UPI00100EFEBC|nr:LCP family protein [Ammoniphilus sp. CFH 90114]RXT04097.1 LytR family transcriptional regulator [Ammoniphilus sp. CFH 90114]
MQHPTRRPQVSASTNVRRRRKGKKRRVGRIIFSFFFLLCLVGASAMGYAAWRVDQAMDQLVHQSQPEAKTEISPTTVKENEISSPIAEPDEKKTLSVLIMGRDYRPETGTNLTDVMIVAAIDLENSKVSMVSIPRDMKVRLPELNKRVKANEVFNYGEHIKKQAEKKNKTSDTDGSTLSKEMAGSLFDIPVDHYILVDFQSFMALVDEVGGIHVEVERDMIYNDPTDNTHINLRAGQQQLNGKKALDWVRHRQDDRGEAYFSSDFDRNQRQKEAIKAIAQELTTWKGLTRIFDVMDTMAKHVETDLSKEQMKELFWAFKSLDTENVKSIETPNVYWDSVQLQTVIPKEDLSAAHHELEYLLNKGKSS